MTDANTNDTTAGMAYQSIARCYADANAKQPSSYWDYDAFQVQWK
jgi:casein kinase II subunit alpha